MKSALVVLCSVLASAVASADAPDQTPKSDQIEFSLPSAVIGVGIGSLTAGIALYAYQFVEAADLRNNHTYKITGDIYGTDLTHTEYDRRKDTIMAEFYTSIGLAVFGVAVTALGVVMEIFSQPEEEK